jgi:hypothetical protein
MNLVIFMYRKEYFFLNRNFLNFKFFFLEGINSNYEEFLNMF